MNKNYIKDVQQFCSWLAPIMQWPSILQEDYSDTLYYLEHERGRLRATKMRKDTTKTYDEWAKSNL